MQYLGEMISSRRPTPRLPVRLPVRFSAEDLARLRERSAQLNLPLTSTVRALARQALSAERDQRLEELEAVAVAGLMAAEHAVHLLEALFPNAAGRSAQLTETVRVAALERVAAVRRDLEEAAP